MWIWHNISQETACVQSAPSCAERGERQLIMNSLDFLRELFYVSSDNIMLHPIMAPEMPCSLLELPHRLPHNYTIGFII